MKLITSPDQLDQLADDLFVGDIIMLADGQAAIFSSHRRVANEFEFFWRTTSAVWIKHPLPEDLFPIRFLFSQAEEAKK